MKLLVAVLLVLVGAINAYPLVGMLSAARLEALYGIPVADPSLEILLRHRAVLIGSLGLGLIAAAFRPAWRVAAGSAGFVSMASFVAFAWAVDGANAAVARVATADAVACVLLAVALALDRHLARSPAR